MDTLCLSDFFDLFLIDFINRRVYLYLIDYTLINIKYTYYIFNINIISFNIILIIYLHLCTFKTPIFNF